MKRPLILSMFCFVFMISKSQMDFSVSGMYSAPLDQFCINDYNEGWGAKFGLGYTFLTDQSWGVEVGGNWLISNNGWRKAALDFGDYTLKNNFYNWQIKGNIVFEQGLFKHYLGVNVGRARYFTTEYLGFNNTQEDGSTYFDDVLYKQRVFQYGAQIGTYIKMNDIVSFDLGMSVLKSPESVKYINFESYSFDGEAINYDEPTSSPFMSLLAGMDIHPIHLIMITTILDLVVNVLPLLQADVHPGIQTEVLLLLLLLLRVVLLKNQLLSCIKMVKHQLNMNNN